MDQTSPEDIPVVAVPVRTLAIDIGGSGMKAALLDETGNMVTARMRVPTPVPATPDAVLDALVELVAPLGPFERISVGFPGVVRLGRIVTAPNLGTSFWRDMRLDKVLQERLNAPARILNDASVQGLGIIVGQGVECVLTLGTGMGFALFENGRLSAHIELGQHRVRKGLIYDAYIGSAGLKDVGVQKWNGRLKKVVAAMRTLTNFDTLYLGGGNAKYIKIDLPTDVKLAKNEAGIKGGVRLWDANFDPSFA